MENTEIQQERKEIETVCCTVKRLVGRFQYDECDNLIAHAMEKYPHAPEPHNLLGVVSGKTGRPFNSDEAFSCGVGARPHIFARAGKYGAARLTSLRGAVGFFRT